MEPLRVSEVFYSPQGEGARAGEMSVFVRLQGCSAKHACFESGVVCDTEFESGVAYSLEALLAFVQHASAGCRWIVWTGGEPLDQLTPATAEFFALAGYRQALETSGVRSPGADLMRLLDWVVVSPKVAEHVLVKHFGGYERYRVRRHGEEALAAPVNVDELRYVRHKGQGVPNPSLTAQTYYVSPHSNGLELDQENLEHCMRLIRENPKWRLSIQMHKAWRVL